MRRVVGAKLLRANGRKTPPCVFPLPARFFCCQPRCFVRQHPRSAALVLAFLCPPPFFCSPPRCFVRQRPRSAAFLLAFPPGLRVSSPAHRLSSAAPPHCRFAITPFRVYFSSLVAAKGFVLLNIRARRLAPLVVIVRGAQLFLAFLSLVSGSLRPFFC